eukprot:1161417-Pelagomonas_calceolata.AAC.3
MLAHTAAQQQRHWAPDASTHCWSAAKALIMSKGIDQRHWAPDAGTHCCSTAKAWSAAKAWARDAGTHCCTEAKAVGT